jgi:hypothetical protein
MDGHLAEFCFRRKHEERLARELANKDRYRPSRGVPESRLVSRGEGMVRTIYPRERRELVPRVEPPHREGGRSVGFGHGEFAGHSFPRERSCFGFSRVKFSELIFLCVLALLVVWLLVFRWSFGNGIGD